MAFLEHLMLKGAILDWQFSIFKNEFLQNVAIVRIYGENLGKANEDFFLHLILWVDEWCQLFSEVYSFNDCNLCGFFFVFLEKVGESKDDWVCVECILLGDSQHLVILRQFG